MNAVTLVLNGDATATALWELFRGSDLCHGTYDHKSVKPAGRGEKVLIKEAGRGVTTLKSPATSALWQRHLAGAQPLGVAPLRDDGTCCWGAIDVDEYDLSLHEVAGAVAKYGFPLVPCRSKSGGAHLYLFLSAPTPADDVQAALTRMATKLGHPDAEVFPKQTHLSEDGLPSWLNMPYFDAEQSTRNGIKAGGLEMTLSEFMAKAKGSAIPPADLASLAPEPYRASGGHRTSGGNRKAVSQTDANIRLAWWAEQIVGAPAGTASNKLAGILFDVGRWMRDTPLAETTARPTLLAAWIDRKRSSREPPGDDAAEREFADIWRRQTATGDRKGRTVEKDEADSAVITRMSDVTPQKIEWLWPGRFAMGKLSLLAGHPGLGKSNLALWIAAQVTTGRDWPEGEGTAPQGDVLILSAEDDPTDTIRPRLDAAGADSKRAHAVEAVRTGKGERSFDLGRDVAVLGDLLAQMSDVRLVIVDPISAYLGGIDSHRNTDVRGALAPLQKLAEQYRVAVLLVSHLRKAGGDAINAVQGSGAFVAAVRTACIVAKEYDVTEDGDGRMQKVETGRRIVSVAKNNLGPDGSEQSLAYRIGVVELGNDIAAPVVQWAGRVTISADDAINPSAKTEKAGKPRDEAKAFLRKYLRDGAAPAADVKAGAAERGITERTLEYAKKELSVGSEKKSKGWFWFLPGRQAEMPL